MTSPQRDLESTIWERPDFQRLSPAARLLYVNLRTNSLTHLSGLYQAPLSFLENVTGLTGDELEYALHELSKEGFAYYDTETAFVLVLGMIRNNSPKIADCITTHLNRYVPDTFLVDIFLQAYPHFKAKIDRRNMVTKFIPNRGGIDRVSIHKYIPPMPSTSNSTSKSKSVSESVSPEEEARALLEEGKGGPKKRSPKKEAGKKAKRPRPKKPPAPIVASYASFDIPKDFYEELLADFKLLGEPAILYQLKKASNYCEDHPEKYAREENGKVKAFRVFIKNWLERELERVKAKGGEEAPALSGFNPPKEDCPHCLGMGIENVEDNGKIYGAICRCRRPGHKAEEVRQKDEALVSKDPKCDCDRGMRKGNDGKIAVCHCIRRQTEDLKDVVPRQSQKATPSPAVL